MSTIVVIKLSVTSRKYFLVFNTNDNHSPGMSYPDALLTPQYLDAMMLHFWGPVN